MFIPIQTGSMKVQRLECNLNLIEQERLSSGTGDKASIFPWDGYTQDMISITSCQNYKRKRYILEYERGLGGNTITQLLLPNLGWLPLSSKFTLVVCFVKRVEGPLNILSVSVSTVLNFVNRAHER